MDSSVVTKQLPVYSLTSNLFSAMNGNVSSVCVICITQIVAFYYSTCGLNYSSCHVSSRATDLTLGPESDLSET